MASPAAAAANAQPAMRVLVLHPALSSSHVLFPHLKELHGPLANKHGIELVYVDAPFSCGADAGGDGAGDAAGRIEQAGDAGGAADTGRRTRLLENGDGAEEEGSENAAANGGSLVLAATGAEGGPGATATTAVVRTRPRDAVPPSEPRRRWFDAAPPSILHGDAGGGNPKFVGLDAAVLHLRQVWSKYLHSAPFAGVLGFGQGAAVAAMLPLLRSEGGDDMFQGLRFAIMVDGYDIVSGNSDGIDGNERKAEDDDENKSWFDDDENDSNGVDSLHIFGEGADGSPGRSRRAAALARRYGSRAQIHTYAAPKDATDAASERSDGGIADPPVRLKKRSLNVVGRFLVEQMNRLVRSHAAGRARSRQLSSLIAATQSRLAAAEREAARAMAASVALRPPRALVAVIGPDAVGGWTGHKERNPEDGGGAPCPAEFVLREEDRPGRARVYQRKAPRDPGGGGEGGGEGEEGWNDFRDASREHPNAAPSADQGA